MGNTVLWILPFIGFFGGLIAGLLGLGGGVVIFPLLVFVGGIPLKLATGTGLLHIFFVSVIGGFIHHRRGKVDSKAGIFLGISGIVGGVVGSYLSLVLSDHSLQSIYLLVVILAIILLFIPQKLNHEGYKSGDFNRVFGVAIGFIVGCLAGLLGVGGGFIIIPLMTCLLKIPLRIAIGTSLLVIQITALGTILAKYSVGHIDLIITSLVLMGAVIGAILGAIVSLGSPVKLLRVILLSFLIMIFFYVGYKTFYKHNMNSYRETNPIQLDNQGDREKNNVCTEIRRFFAFRIWFPTQNSFDKL